MRLAGRGAGWFPRHVWFAVLACLAWAAGACASPFVPGADTVVLERLPDAGDLGARAVRAKHRALAADPHDLTLALVVARGDLDRARALGDPRYLGRAEAALAPWPPAPSAPPDTLLLHATILQSNHDFGGALGLLDTLLARHPGNGQAWLTRAAIHQAQGDFPAAVADCGQLADLMLGLAPDICTASAMAMTGHAPLALRAVGLSLSVNAAEAARAPGEAMWAMTLAAETAARLGDASAEAWFARALALDGRDPYLQAAWADWLLDHGRPRAVIALLADRTRIDPLLLRLALAEQAVGAPELAGHVADLAARFESSRLRGEVVHRREEARFELALRNRPAAALALARANWQVQREPADALVLLQAALAAGDPGAAAPVLTWIARYGVQDVQLAALAARLGKS